MGEQGTPLPQSMLRICNSVHIRDIFYYALQGLVFLHQIQSSFTEAEQSNIDHSKDNKQNHTSVDYVLHTKHNQRNSHLLYNNHSSIKLQEWHKELYPNPLTDHRRCGRRKPSYVCDPAYILTREDKHRLDSEIQTACQQTPCPCKANCTSSCQGFLISVAVVPKMAMNFGELMTAATNSQLEVEEWARYLRTVRWHYDQCGNHLVIVLAVHDHKIYTSVGDTAVPRISAVCANSVYHDAKRNLQTGHYGSALSQMIRDYRDVLNNEFKCVLDWDHVMPTGIIIAIIFGSVCLPLILCVLLVFLGPWFRGRGFGGSRHKTTFSKYRYHHQADFEVSTDENMQYTGHI